MSDMIRVEIQKIVFYIVMLKAATNLEGCGCWKIWRGGTGNTELETKNVMTIDSCRKWVVIG